MIFKSKGLNISTTLSTMGILMATCCKICNWLFKTCLTSSTYSHLHINKSAFEHQICPYVETIIKEMLPMLPSYLFFFFRTSSLLLRLSCSVLDSTADLTFDPVSARFSTGTQPRSVIQQNQNNKALTPEMKANDTLFMLNRLIYKCSIFLYGWSAYLKSTHCRQLALLQSMQMKKRGTEKQTG